MTLMMTKLHVFVLMVWNEQQLLSKLIQVVVERWVHDIGLYAQYFLSNPYIWVNSCQLSKRMVPPTV